MSDNPNPLQRIAWSGHTDCGKVRKNNEDSFLGLLVDAQGAQLLGKIGDSDVEKSDFVFAVSDGMGGAMAGEFASKIAVEKITKLLPPVFAQGASGISSGFRDVLQEVFVEIHRALLYLGSCYDECRGMGATLSLCWFTPGWMYFAHLGDSRIYFLPAAGGMKQITDDDTYVGWLFRNGQINEREAKNHPQRNVLQKVLGADPQQIEPQTGAVGLEPGDRFLLCTDGVTDGLFDSRIEDILRNTPREAAPALVREAIAASGRDNATALVVDIFG